MGEFNIYISGDIFVIPYDLFPGTNAMGIPENLFSGDKVQNITTIEPRGKNIQDGFRTKKEYIHILNNETDKYVTTFYLLHINRVIQSFMQYNPKFHKQKYNNK